MSTEIAEIQGREETKESYDPSSIHINRFYGGKDNGQMIQLTLSSGGHIQLTKQQVQDLGVSLLDSFEADIYPSE